MTNFTNVIRNINRRVDSIVGIFGMDSREYNKIKSAVKKYIPDALIAYDDSGKIRVVSSAKVIRKATRTPYKKQRLAEKVNEAFSVIKKAGTARQQAEKYTGKKNLSVSDYATIKAQANIAFEEEKNTDTFYITEYSTIDPKYKNVLDKLWRARRGKRGKKAKKAYDRIVETIEEFKKAEEDGDADDWINKFEANFFNGKVFNADLFFKESEETAVGDSLPAGAFLGY